MDWLTRVYLRVRLEINSFLERQEGQGATEYAMIIGLVVVVAAALLLAFGGKLKTFWDSTVSPIFNNKPVTK
jgi:Flp pilus assembly pilin Flp